MELYWLFIHRVRGLWEFMANQVLKLPRPCYCMHASLEWRCLRVHCVVSIELASALQLALTGQQCYVRGNLSSVGTSVFARELGLMFVPLDINDYISDKEIERKLAYWEPRQSQFVAR